jgi:hypothetical protein
MPTSPAAIAGIRTFSGAGVGISPTARLSPRRVDRRGLGPIAIYLPASTTVSGTLITSHALSQDRPCQHRGSSGCRSSRVEVGPVRCLAQDDSI